MYKNKEEKINNSLKCGDIFYADLSGTQGSEQGGIRPILIVQNNDGNKYSPTTIGIPITTKLYKTNLPVHVIINPDESGLLRVSMVLTEQIRTVDKSRLIKKIGHLDKIQMKKVRIALFISCLTEDKETTDIEQDYVKLLIAV